MGLRLSKPGLAPELRRVKRQTCAETPRVQSGQSLGVGGDLRGPRFLGFASMDRRRTCDSRAPRHTQKGSIIINGTAGARCASIPTSLANQISAVRFVCEVPRGGTGLFDLDIVWRTIGKTTYATRWLALV